MRFIKRQENLGGQNLRAQIYGQGWIPDPLHRSIFNKGGGGGSKIVRASFNGLDRGTHFYGLDWILDTFGLSTFNKGVGVQNGRLCVGPAIICS
jgi:hypothetical protein